MSFERAKIFCNRCYGLAEHDKKVGRTPLDNDQIYESREKAMIALEGIIDSADNFLNNSELPEERRKYFQEQKVIAENGLDICSKCDYSQPSIIKVIERVEYEKGEQ